jgi:hypothetical protein
VSDELDHEPLLETDRLLELTAVVMRMLDDWGVDPKDQPALLGLPVGTRARVLERFRRGTPFPQDRATLQRISHLLTIERAVRTAFPHNAAMARYWVTTPNLLLSNQTPLQVMLAGGMEGMEQVVAYLNCTESW